MEILMILDLFAGMGGWSEGLAALGYDDIGIEMDAAACRTRVAAGHATIRADVTTMSFVPFIGKVDGIIASPPCTDWSASGNRKGLDGETGALVLEIDRWVRVLKPRWVACEQVPPAIEWWHRFAHEWQALGYATWAGVLNSADYGVPQTRQRAILLASLDRSVGPPPATHDRTPHPSLFGDDLAAWVSMADALGWSDFDAHYQRGAGLTERHGTRPDRPCEAPAPTLTGSALGAGAGAKLKFVVRTGNNSHVTSRIGSKAGEGGVELYERSVEEPAPTLDAKVGSAWRVVSNNSVAGAGRAERGIDEPAFTVTGRADLWKLHPNRDQWWWDQPSTTLGGDPRVSPRCHHDEGMQGRGALAAAAAAAGEGTGIEPIRLTLTDALILQSFRSDYPVTGNKTKQFEQVGNAVPPLLARHVLAQVVGQVLSR